MVNVLIGGDGCKAGEGKVRIINGNREHTRDRQKSREKYIENLDIRIVMVLIIIKGIGERKREGAGRDRRIWEKEEAENKKGNIVREFQLTIPMFPPY